METLNAPAVNASARAAARGDGNRPRELPDWQRSR